MISYDDFKKIIKDILNDRVMKWPLRVTTIVLAVAIVIEVPWYFSDKYKGKHDKLFWGVFECNIPKDHPDTIYKNSIKTVYKTDTVYKQVVSKKNFNNKINKVNTLNQN